MKILLLEDDLILKESITEYLEAQNFQVDGFDNSNDAFDAIFEREYDLLLLDVNVTGDWNGFALRRELKSESKDIPTIFVTSVTSADAIIQGYESGGSDYIKKPFELVELLLRIRQALKVNYFLIAENILELGEEMHYNLSTFELMRNGAKVRLSKRERELMNLFVKHKNQLVTLEYLYDAIWDNDVDPVNARVQINNLRRKLPKGMIANVYGEGYRFDYQ